MTITVTHKDSYAPLYIVRHIPPHIHEVGRVAGFCARIEEVERSVYTLDDKEGFQQYTRAAYAVYIEPTEHLVSFDVISERSAISTITDVLDMFHVPYTKYWHEGDTKVVSVSFGG